MNSKIPFSLTATLAALAVTSCVICSPSSAQLTHRDVRVSLARIDPKSGKTVWSFAFDRKMTPYRCEVYAGKIAAFLYSAKDGFDAKTTEAVFLNAKTGERITPFDTLAIPAPDDDPEFARSGLGTADSDEEKLDRDRSEIELPNGWRSHSFVNPSTQSEGSNSLYFFKGPKLQWTMKLPQLAFVLSNWNDILVCGRQTKEGLKWVDTLYGQVAGTDSAIWEFRLPSDIPDRKMPPTDVLSDDVSRMFTSLIGKTNIFVFGGGTLFAPDPQTGKLLWRHSVVDDADVKKNAVPLDNADMIQGDESLFLISEGALVRFDLGSKSATAVLRKDLCSSPLPIYIGGAIYCFTAKP
jgi:outer membrane protein assembly factor BamB